MITEALRNKGMAVYELHSKYLHQKIYIADNQVFTLGSFNNDRISWRINNELNILVSEKEAVDRLLTHVQYLKS